MTDVAVELRLSTRFAWKRGGRSTACIPATCRPVRRRAVGGGRAATRSRATPRSIVKGKVGRQGAEVRLPGQAGRTQQRRIERLHREALGRAPRRRDHRRDGPARARTTSWSRNWWSWPRGTGSSRPTRRSWPTRTSRGHELADVRPRPQASRRRLRRLGESEGRAAFARGPRRNRCRRPGWPSLAAPIFGMRRRRPMAGWEAAGPRPVGRPRRHHARSRLPRHR